MACIQDNLSSRALGLAAFRPSARASKGILHTSEWHAQRNYSCEIQIGNPKLFPFASEICINDCK